MDLNAAFPEGVIAPQMEEIIALFSQQCRQGQSTTQAHFNFHVIMCK
jgi:hypothetical protein